MVLISILPAAVLPHSSDQRPNYLCTLEQSHKNYICSLSCFICVIHEDDGNNDYSILAAFSVQGYS